MRSYLARLFRYVTWADLRAVKALQAAPIAQAEALPLLAHLLAAEHVWLARLEQREPRHLVWPKLSLAECATLAAENTAGFAALLDRLSDEQLDAIIRYRNTQGLEFANTVTEILTHVVTHGAYHRGQIAKAIGRSGGAAVNTDFIMFLREGESA